MVILNDHQELKKFFIYKSRNFMVILNVDKENAGVKSTKVEILW